MTTMFKKFATGTAALALMTTVFASGTLAANDEVTTGIEGNEFTISEILTTSFSDSFKLDGTNQKIDGAAIQPFKVTDPRGTGAGWKVTIGATQFTDSVSSKTLPLDAVNLTAPTIEKAEGAEGSSETTTIARAGGQIGVETVTVLSAVEGGGMGTYNVSSMPLELNLLPKDVYAGNYTSTVTVTLVTGP